MTASILESVGYMQIVLWGGFVVFLRVGAIAALLPGFGENSVSVRVKLATAMAFTMIVAPAVSEIPDFSEGRFGTLVFSESLSGALLGVGVRLFILALQTAGTIAAQSTSLSQILGSAGVDPMPAMGHFLVIGSICLAVTMGLHIKAAHLMIVSYEILPIGFFTPGEAIADWGLDQIRLAFQLAFTLAAPFVILSLLYNLVLGVINKAMPQLMVAFVGAPLITFGGLFMLFLTAPVMLEVWLSGLDNFLQDPMRAIP